MPSKLIASIFSAAAVLLPLAGPASATALEPVPVVTACSSYHDDPGAFQPSQGLISATQRLMVPRRDGSRRTPRVIYRSLHRQGYKLSYARKPEAVLTSRPAILAEGSNSRRIILAQTEILQSGTACPSPDGSTSFSPGTRTRYVLTYTVRPGD